MRLLPVFVSGDPVREVVRASRLRALQIDSHAVDGVGHADFDESVERQRSARASAAARVSERFCR